MKKTLVAFAALSAFAGAASAQSSVTLFGVVDAGVRYVKGNGDSIKSLTSNGNSNSRLGFRGVEDLGGGLKAGFWLEGQIFPDTGSGANTGAFAFERRSTLSLLGGFGEIRLGRDYTPTYFNHNVFDVFSVNGVGSNLNISAANALNSTAAAGNNGDLTGGTFTRTSNTIGYFLPSNLGGIYGQLQVASGEGASAVLGVDKYYGGRIGYKAGPFDIAFAAGRTELVGGLDVDAINIGGSYSFGFGSLMAQYSQYDRDASAFGDLKNFSIGAIIPLGGGSLKASYGQTMADGTARDAKLFAIGYVYDFSKRTALYATVSRIDNDAGSRYSVGTAQSNGSGNRIPALGGNSTGAELGIRHNF